MDRLVMRYYAGAVAHGLARTLVLTHDASVISGETKRPMLVSERVLLVSANTFINPFICPLLITHDVVGVEAWARGFDIQFKPRLFIKY
jgi:hypothetical protein